MKTWKIILATLVIYGAGVVTGGLIVKQALRLQFSRLLVNPPPGNLPPWAIMRREFLERMDRELALTPDQYARIEKIMAESQERTRVLWEIIGPEMQEELRLTREKIRGELSPEQQTKFQELLRPRFRRRPDGAPSRRQESGPRQSQKNPSGARTSPP